MRYSKRLVKTRSGSLISEGSGFLSVVDIVIVR